MANYQIFTDATADLSAAMLAGLPPVEIIPMRVEVGGKEYTYGPGGTITAEQFYDLQRDGAFATTSQINPSAFREVFAPCLAEGKDILYLCFSSGLSGSFQSAQLCIEELREEYPDCVIRCVDTLAASVGEGFLVREALYKQSEGLSLDELARWVEEHRLQVCHWFTVDTFEHLRHGGRVSGTAAAVGTMLQIKPLLHVDNEGHLQAMEKPRGRRKAIQSQVTKMEQGWTPQLGETVLIGHGDSPEAAEQLRQAILDRFPNAVIDVAPIGPIIGAHTGPGVLALFYWGTNR